MKTFDPEMDTALSQPLTAAERQIMDHYFTPLVQDLDEMPQAIAEIRDFLKRTGNGCYQLGDAVRTEEGLIGVVVGITAPTTTDAEHSYLVCLPNTDDPPEADGEWHDHSQLEKLEM